jgi:hypothetical protein
MPRRSAEGKKRRKCFLGGWEKLPRFFIAFLNSPCYETLKIKKSSKNSRGEKKNEEKKEEGHIISDQPDGFVF